MDSRHNLINEQLRLACTRLKNSEANGRPDADGAWEEEIERRITNIDAGLAKSRPFAEIAAEIDRHLGRWASSRHRT